MDGFYEAGWNSFDDDYRTPEQRDRDNRVNILAGHAAATKAAPGTSEWSARVAHERRRLRHHTGSELRAMVAALAGPEETKDAERQRAA